MVCYSIYSFAIVEELIITIWGKENRTEVLHSKSKEHKL